MRRVPCVTMTLDIAVTDTGNIDMPCTFTMSDDGRVLVDTSPADLIRAIEEDARRTASLDRLLFTTHPELWQRAHELMWQVVCESADATLVIVPSLVRPRVVLLMRLTLSLECGVFLCAALGAVVCGVPSHVEYQPTVLGGRAGVASECGDRFVQRWGGGSSGSNCPRGRHHTHARPSETNPFPLQPPFPLPLTCLAAGPVAVLVGCPHSRFPYPLPLRVALIHIFCSKLALRMTPPFTKHCPLPSFTIHSLELRDSQSFSWAHGQQWHVQPHTKVVHMHKHVHLM